LFKRNIFCQKFVNSVGTPPEICIIHQQIATSCPAYFLTHNATDDITCHRCQGRIVKDGGQRS